MNPPQTLHHRPHLLHIHHPHLLADPLLHRSRAVQELFDQFTVHEPERLFRFTDAVVERSVRVERNIARRLHAGGNGLLKAHEQILLRVRDESEEVDGAVDLGSHHRVSEHAV